MENLALDPSAQPKLQERPRHALIALALLALLLANPVVLYLLTGHALVAFALPVTAGGLLLGLYAGVRSRLPLAYAINLLSLVSLFVHAEVVFRHQFADYAIEDLYTIEDGYYFNKPNLVKRFDDKEYQTDYLTNRQGFRIGYGQHTEDEVTQADWLFVGDSYTQGAQVQFEELYTSLLYQHFPDRVIVNAGISGFGLPQEYRYYMNAGRQLKPEKVFLQICNFNDFMNVVERRVGVTDYLVHHSEFLRFLLQDIKYQNPAALPLGRWTEPFHPDASANRDFNVFFREDSQRKRADLAAFRRYLRLFKEETARDGAELVVVLIPTKEQVDPRYFDEVVTAFGIKPGYLDMDRPNRIVRELADSLGIRLIDATDAFRAASAARPFYDYDEHLSREGHRLLAATIAAEVQTATEVRVLGPEVSGERYPSYGADGASLTYQAFRDGNSELFIADTSFASVARLTYNDVPEAHPTLSPDGTRLAFTEGDQETLRTRVVVMGLGGENRRPITAGRNDYGSIPAFSPDGSSIAFASWSFDETDGTPALPRIAIADLKTGARRYITEPGRETWRPAYAPDGRSVAYIARDQDQFDVFLYDLTTGQERRLTATPYDEWDVAFSPDGTRLAYAGKASGNWDLFVLDLTTSRTERLTQTRGDEWDPAFSPRGDALVFAGQFGFMKGMYRMPLSTGGARR